MQVLSKMKNILLCLCKVCFHKQTDPKIVLLELQRGESYGVLMYLFDHFITDSLPAETFSLRACSYALGLPFRFSKGLQPSLWVPMFQRPLCLWAALAWRYSYSKSTSPRFSCLPFCNSTTIFFSSFCRF